MKDTIHHRQYIQKKVIQSIRKEMEKQSNAVNYDDTGVVRPVSQLDLHKRRLSARRRPVRIPSRTAIH